MEIVNKAALKNISLRAVIFDFDGTISTLRQGWEKVMKPLMLEMIDPDGCDIALEDEISRFIDESTGIQTVFQMQWLAEKVRIYGRNKIRHDEWWYKEEYNRRLMQNVTQRLADLNSGKRNKENYMIGGSRNFLERLQASRMELYVASGTDESDVAAEVKALGLSGYFAGIAGALSRNTECPKEAVIRRLMEDQKLSGKSLLVVGDGKVEIRLGKEAGALTLGMATDEIKLTGINETKRRRLIDAGADIIAGDFGEIEAISKLLNL